MFNQRAREHLQICFYPIILSKVDAAVCARFVRFALAPLSKRASIYLSENSDFPSNDWPDFCTIIDGKRLHQIASESDKVIFWCASDFWRAPASLRRKAILCDPYTNFAATDLLNSWVSKEVYSPEVNRTAFGIFKKMRNVCIKDNRDVLLIGPAPSQYELMKSNKKIVGNPLCIYIGSAIYNEHLTSLYPPDIIVAADGTSQFSGLQPSLRFRSRVELLIEQTGSLLFVPSNVFGIISAHWQENLISSILTIPYYKKMNDKIQRLLHEDWVIHPTGNVLTTLALPVAQSLSQNIRFSGISFFETAANDELHWVHANSTQYYRNNAEILIKEPGAVLPNLGYKEQHYSNLKSQLHVMKTCGFSFYRFDGSPLSELENLTDTNVLEKSIWIKSIENIVIIFERIQHFAGLLTIFFAGLVLLLPMALLSILPVNLTLIVLLVLCIFVSVSGVYFLRMRMNRMLANIEGRLSRQQAAQFENLSTRLEYIERAIENENNEGPTQINDRT